MQENFFSHWIEIVSGLLGAGGLSAYLARRKLNGEGAKAEAEAMAIKTDAKHTHFDELMRTIEMLRDEVERLTGRLERAEQDAAAAKRASEECGEREAGLKKRIEALERALGRKGGFRK